MGAATPAACVNAGSQEGPGDLADLLGRIKRRDPAGLRALYLAYSRRVHGYAFQVLRDEHAAEDVVHDVFIRVWRYAASYDPQKGAKPEAWLFQIARNVALDEAGHRARMVHADHEETEAPQDEGQPEPGEAAAQLADRVDTRGEAFGQALLGLPSHCRQVLHLRFHHGMTNPEIAKHLGIPLGTAKTWLRRGVLQMRERMNVVVAGERQQEEWA